MSFICLTSFLTQFWLKLMSIIIFCPIFEIWKKNYSMGMGNFPFFLFRQALPILILVEEIQQKRFESATSTPKTRNNKQTKSTSIRFKMSDAKITPKSVLVGVILAWWTKELLLINYAISSSPTIKPLYNLLFSVEKSFRREYTQFNSQHYFLFFFWFCRWRADIALQSRMVRGWHNGYVGWHGCHETHR